MPKADGIKDLKIHYPDCFTDNGFTFPECEDIEVVAVDFIAAVKQLSNPSIVKWKDAYNGLMNETKHSFSKFKKLLTVVNSCDSYHFGNYAKLVEQADRDAKKEAYSGSSSSSSGSAAADFAPGAMEDTIDQYQIAAALGDRDVGVPSIVRWFILAVVADNQLSFLRAGSKHKIIYDGHYLREGDLDHLGLTVHPDCPLAVSREADGQLKVEFLKNLSHAHGEADLAIPWIMRQVAAPQQVCAILSPDSDMVWNFLRFLEAYQDFAPRILIRRWPTLSWCVSANPFPDIDRLKTKDERDEARAKASGVPRKGPKKGQIWVDINRLRDQIVAQYPGIPEEERVASLAVLYAFAIGNDYMDSFKRVPIHHWRKQWDANYQKFGALTRRITNAAGDFEWELQAGPMAMLAEYACQQSSTRKKEAVTGDFKTRSKNHPGEKGVSHKVNHARYWALMSNSIGKPVFSEPPLDEFSYGLVDDSVEPTRKNANLVRVHGDTEVQKWSHRFQKNIVKPSWEKPKSKPLSAFGSAAADATVLDE